MKKLITAILAVIMLIATTATVFAAYPAGTENWKQAPVAPYRYMRTDDVKITDIPADIYTDAMASMPSDCTLSPFGGVDAYQSGHTFFMFAYTPNDKSVIAKSAKIYEVNTGHSLFAEDFANTYKDLGIMQLALAKLHPNDFYENGVVDKWNFKEIANPVPYGNAIAPVSAPVRTPDTKPEKINVILNGTAVNFAGQPPVIKDGTMFLPVRVVSEQLGFSATWDGDTKTATLTNGKDVIVTTVGQTTFTVNGKTVTSTAPAQNINGSIMLPMRSICESLGATVDWDNATKTATISYVRP